MARSKDFVADFAAAVGNDTLPQVSWLVGPTLLSEHATNHPADGEDLTARLLKVLGDPANAKVFEKTVFILNYDEGGQFFDHLWTPVPPKNAAEGASTVTAVGELTTESIQTVPAGNPIGLGFRVPFFAVSPWSRGGYVYSEVSDHTSVIKFIEKRFGVHCPNISPWRRAVVSDLTAAFDFTAPDFSPWAPMPDTSANVNTSKKECETLPAPTLPQVQSMPQQEPGTRPSRALPYRFEMTMTAKATPAGADLTFTVVNSGSVGVVIFMYDRVDASSTTPLKYTVEGGKTLSSVVSVSTGSRYGYSAHGPNGFVRQFMGVAKAPTGSAMVNCNGEAVVISMVSLSAASLTYNLTDNAYGGGSVTATVGKGVSTHSFNVVSSAGWYDISVGNGVEGWRFMGRVDSGKPTTSDPAVSSGRAPTALPAVGFPVGMEGYSSVYGESHSDTPHWYRTGVKKWDMAALCRTERSKHKDHCTVVRNDEL